MATKKPMVKRGPGSRRAHKARISEKEQAAFDDFRAALCKATTKPDDTVKMFSDKGSPSEKVDDIPDFLQKTPSATEPKEIPVLYGTVKLPGFGPPAEKVDAAAAQLENPVLAERESTYGDFGQQCQIIAGIESAVHGSPGWAKMTPTMREAMGQIITKIGRLCNGDPAHKDSWVDIAGYAELQALRLGDKPAPVSPVVDPIEEEAKRLGIPFVQVFVDAVDPIEEEAKRLYEEFKASFDPPWSDPGMSEGYRNFWRREANAKLRSQGDEKPAEPTKAEVNHRAFANFERDMAQMGIDRRWDEVSESFQKRYADAARTELLKERSK